MILNAPDAKNSITAKPMSTVAITKIRLHIINNMVKTVRSINIVASMRQKRRKKLVKGTRVTTFITFEVVGP